MNRKGFTLIEVLTVIAIIGILVSITSFVYASALVRSRDQQRISDLKTVQNALEQYYMDYRNYPALTADNATNLSAKAVLETECVKNCLAPKYLTTIPTDPRFVGKNDFLYLPLAKVNATGAKGYYLAAKVEREQNASASSPSAEITTYDYLSDDYNLCTKTNFNSSSCTHFYYLKNSHNN